MNEYISLNIPKCDSKVLYGCELRSAFVCKPPYVMIGSDLSGIEARILGHFTSYFDEGSLARELVEGDIHQKTADTMGVSRNTAKTVRYAIMYGAGISKLARIVGCSNKDAEKYLKLFYDSSPSLRDVQENLEKFYKKNKYIKAIDGRRLYIRSSHVLLNSLIQASSAIIFKKWMTRVWEYIDELELDAVVIIAFHDEIQLRVHEDDVEKTKEIIYMALKDTQEYYKVKTLLECDVKTSTSWAGSH